MTRKNKNYITLEKYEKNILGYNKIYYVIKMNQKYKCNNKLKIKNNYRLFRNYLIKKMGLKKYILNNKILSNKIDKNKNIIKNIKNIFDPTIKYNYCLSKNKLILSPSRISKKQLKFNTFFSNHAILCNKNPYAAGEMVFYKKSLIFNNISGTYEPKLKDIEILKKALPFLKVKVVDMNSKLNKKYFG